MRPALHDFDVITDSPAPNGRLPEPAEQPPPPRAPAQISTEQVPTEHAVPMPHAVPVPHSEAERVRAAE